jgi:hypothetical protein
MKNSCIRSWSAHNYFASCYYWKRKSKSKNRTKNMPTLLSPTDLARPAINIAEEETEYNYSTQTRFGTSDKHISPMATTYNGTQTFDSHGKPKDSDNDK